MVDELKWSGVRVTPASSYRQALSRLSALLIALALVGCSVGYDKHEFRYRLTINVQTPEGVRSGSGVISVTVGETPMFLPGSRIVYGLHGEAIPIDLPNGHTLYALLSAPGRSDEAIHRPLGLFREYLDRLHPWEAGEGPDWEARLETLRRERPHVELRGENRPFLVRFGDPNEPASAEEVDPDQLSAAFGEGYRLLSTTLEVTDDPVTRGIRDRLPWVTEDAEAPLMDPQGSGGTNLSKRLRHRAFLEGRDI